MSTRPSFVACLPLQFRSLSQIQGRYACSFSMLSRCFITYSIHVLPCYVPLDWHLVAVGQGSRWCVTRWVSLCARVHHDPEPVGCVHILSIQLTWPPLAFFGVKFIMCVFLRRFHWERLICACFGCRVSVCVGLGDLCDNCQFVINLNQVW